MTPEQIVLAKAKDGFSVSACALAAGIHPRKAKQIFDAHRIERHRKRAVLTDELIAKIVALNKELYPDAVARVTGLSAVTVCRVLQREGIPPKRKEYEWRAEPPKRDPWKNRREADGAPVRNVTPTPLRDPKAPAAPTTPMEAAKEAFVSGPLLHGLPPRLVITATDMFLDGRPIGLNELMRRTNAMRVAWGLEQIANSPAWRV